MVGRDSELRELQELLRRSRTGQGGLVICSGEAGVGKTTLVGAAAALAREQGGRVLTGHCYDLSAAPPYGPWIEIAREAAPRPDLPLSLASLMSGSPHDGARDRGELFEGVLHHLVTLAAETPLLVVLEDLHWADQASLDLLAFVAARLASEPLLLVATCRDNLSRENPLYHLMPVLVRDCRAHRVELRRLGQGDIQALVAARYPMDPTARECLSSYLQERTEGNPFFIHELLRALEAEEALVRAGENWSVGDLRRVRVPALIQQFIDSGLDKLGPEVRSALEVASVIGQEIPFDVWSAVSGLDHAELLERIRPAWWARFLTESADGERLRFSHELVREALYEGLLPPERRQLHRQVAEALMALPDPSPDDVAHHLQSAGDERAIEWLMRAGLPAEMRYAWVEALQRYEAAYQLLARRGSETLTRGWLAFHIAGLVRYADLEASLRYLQDAQSVAAAIDDPVLSAVSLFHLGFVDLYNGDFGQGLEQVESAVRLMDQTTPEDHDRARQALAAFYPPAYFDNPRTTAGGLFSRIGALPGFNVLRDAMILELSHAGRFQEALDQGMEYVDQVTAATHDERVIQNFCRDAYFGLALANFARGRVADARQWFERALAAYRTLGHHAQVGAVALWELRAVLAYETDRLAERKRLQGIAAQALAVAGGVLGPERGSLAATAGIVDLAFLEGRWEDAHEAAEGAIGQPRPWERFSAMASVGELLRLQGESQAAREYVQAILPDGIDTVPGSRDYFATVQAQLLAAALALDAGKLDQARAWLEAHDRWLAWSGAVHGRVDGLVRWTRYHRMAGDLAAARACANTALRLAQDPYQPVAMIGAHRSLGALCIVEGRYEEAEAQLRAALAIIDTCGATYERALCLFGLAELQAGRGRPGEALSLLDAARNLCLPLNARLTLGWIDDLAARLAPEIASADAANSAGLTERELQVLRLIVAGASNREIADQLFLSVRTVERHISNLYSKIGARSRAAAASFAHEHSLI